MERVAQISGGVDVGGVSDRDRERVWRGAERVRGVTIHGGHVVMMRGWIVAVIVP
jgi:hypothetical protein